MQRSSSAGTGITRVLFFSAATSATVCRSRSCYAAGPAAITAAAWASFFDACVLQRASARWPCLAGQDSRGWGRVRGIVPFAGERGGEIGTDGEAAVQPGEMQ